MPLCREKHGLCVFMCMCADMAAWLQKKLIPALVFPSSFLPSILHNQVPVFSKK